MLKKRTIPQPRQFAGQPNSSGVVANLARLKKAARGRSGRVAGIGSPCQYDGVGFQPSDNQAEPSGIGLKKVGAFRTNGKKSPVRTSR